MINVAHVLSALTVGEKEREVLRLATHGNQEGHPHSLVLFDTLFRSTEAEFHPGEVTAHPLPRGLGLGLRLA